MLEDGGRALTVEAESQYVSHLWCSVLFLDFLCRTLQN